MDRTVARCATVCVVSLVILLLGSASARPATLATDAIRVRTNNICSHSYVLHVYLAYRRSTYSQVIDVKNVQMKIKNVKKRKKRDKNKKNVCKR